MLPHLVAKPRLLESTAVLPRRGVEVGAWRQQATIWSFDLVQKSDTCRSCSPLPSFVLVLQTAAVRPECLLRRYVHFPGYQLEAVHSSSVSCGARTPSAPASKRSQPVQPKPVSDWWLWVPPPVVTCRPHTILLLPFCRPPPTRRERPSEIGRRMTSLAADAADAVPCSPACAPRRSDATYRWFPTMGVTATPTPCGGATRS